jgi:hypothetical protein
MVGHFGVESRLNADFLQQAIELVEIVRGFEILASSLARACNCFRP